MELVFSFFFGKSVHSHLEHIKKLASLYFFLVKGYYFRDSAPTNTSVLRCISGARTRHSVEGSDRCAAVGAGTGGRVAERRGGRGGRAHERNERTREESTGDERRRKDRK